jgi:hypothetical protein
VNDSALGGLLLVALGAGIAVLWYRGYFNDQIAKATGGLSGTTAKQPFVLNLGAFASNALASAGFAGKTLAGAGK